MKKIQSRYIFPLKKALLISSFFILSSLFLNISAEENAEEASSSEEKINLISDLTKDFVKQEGFIDLYQDPKTSSIYLSVNNDLLDKEFIYFAHVRDGVVAAGRPRGSYLDNGVLKIKRHFETLRIERINTSYSFDQGSELSRSSGANISDAVIKILPILAKSEKENEFLVDVTELFLSEALTPIKPIPYPENPNNKFQWGQLSKEKSRVIATYNYPDNTDIEIEHVIENPPSRDYKQKDAADPRNISISLRYSFIKMPNNEFESRIADQRVGFFTTDVTDLTSVDATPYIDLIHKWDLKKKFPEKSLSEPVKPITFWIENSAPKDLRPYIKEGALAWNKAFEKAGFKNAIEIKEQPDDAEWDAGDIRYNVIRWTSSPNPPFGGYGPSFVNPRTGEIIGADIMLEWVYVTNRLTVNNLFPPSNEGFCSAGFLAKEGNMLGNIVNSNTSLSKDPKILQQSLVRLTLHEIGHTLGLNHNFKASYLHDAITVHNPEITSKVGVTSSVMEYPAINLAPIGMSQGDYYDTIPGPYDDWAIEFGYKPLMTKEERKKLLSRSSEPQLMFGNDADDMRAPGKGVDPRAMINDMSSEPIKYASQRIALVNQTMLDLPKILTGKTNTWEEYRNAYEILTREVGRSLEAVSRYIGGVYVNRSTPDQVTNLDPYEPTPTEIQKQAMEILREHAFSPRAFPVSSEVIKLLQKERRGFELRREHEDPQIHRRILSIQGAVLRHLLDGWVLYRLSDTKLYGNNYSPSEMLTDLTNAIFLEDQNTSVNSIRQNLQTFYVRRLLMILSLDYYDEISAAAAYNSLRNIEKIVKKRGKDPATDAHRQLVSWLIESGLDRAQ